MSNQQQYLNPPIPAPSASRSKGPVIVAAVVSAVAFIAGGLLGAGLSHARTVNVATPGPTVTVPGPTFTPPAVTTTVQVPGPRTTVTLPPPGPAISFPGDGTFVVGTDIKPGTYKTAGMPGCYWARLASLDTSNIIDNNNTDGPTTVTILRSDKAFETQGCAGWARVHS